MDLTWLLELWFSHSLFRLLAPTIQTIGFQNPFTLIIITGYNTFSLTTLFLLTVIAYPVLQKKTWTLPLAIATTWILITILFFVNYQQKYGLVSASAVMLPHAWLEFATIFLWAAKLRNACLQNQAPQANSAPDTRTWIKTLKHPAQFALFLVTDIKTTWATTKTSFNTLWTPQLKRGFVFILALIFFAAVLETYVTPAIVAAIVTG